MDRACCKLPTSQYFGFGRQWLWNQPASFLCMEAAELSLSVQDVTSCFPTVPAPPDELVQPQARHPVHPHLGNSRSCPAVLSQSWLPAEVSSSPVLSHGSAAPAAGTCEPVCTDVGLGGTPACCSSPTQPLSPVSRQASRVALVARPASEHVPLSLPSNGCVLKVWLSSPGSGTPTKDVSKTLF